MTKSEERASELEEVRRKAERMRRARRSGRPTWQVLAQASALGWMFVVPVVLGAALGGLLARAIDRPAVALVGVLTGVVVGFYLFFRQVRRSLDDEDGS